MGIDFGLARIITPYASPMGGTTAWEAPEIVCGPPAYPDPSADVFSFGLLAYFAVTGLKHFDAMKRSKIKELMRQGRVMPDVWPLDEPLTTVCHDLCQECLRMEPRSRSSMGAVQVQLSTWFPSVGPPPGSNWALQLRRLREHIDWKASMEAAGLTDVFAIAEARSAEPEVPRDRESIEPATVPLYSTLSVTPEATAAGS